MARVRGAGEAARPVVGGGDFIVAVVVLLFATTVFLLNCCCFRQAKLGPGSIEGFISDVLCVVGVLCFLRSWDLLICD